MITGDQICKNVSMITKIKNMLQVFLLSNYWKSKQYSRDHTFAIIPPHNDLNNLIKKHLNEQITSKESTFTIYRGGNIQRLECFEYEAQR